MSLVIWYAIVPIMTSVYCLQMNASHGLDKSNVTKWIFRDIWNMSWASICEITEIHLVANRLISILISIAPYVNQVSAGIYMSVIRGTYRGDDCYPFMGFSRLRMSKTFSLCIYLWKASSSGIQRGSMHIAMWSAGCFTRLELLTCIFITSHFHGHKHQSSS